MRSFVLVVVLDCAVSTVMYLSRTWGQFSSPQVESSVDITRCPLTVVVTRSTYHFGIVCLLKKGFSLPFDNRNTLLKWGFIPTRLRARSPLLLLQHRASVVVEPPSYALQVPLSRGIHSDS